MATEYVYIGHDNTINLSLRENNVPVDLSYVTQMILLIGDTEISSTNQAATDLILWCQTAYATGEVRMQIGLDDTICVGKYTATLIVYDDNNTNGIVWGTIEIQVLEAAVTP